jgi:hypothetical protein
VIAFLLIVYIAFVLTSISRRIDVIFPEAKPGLGRVSKQMGAEARVAAVLNPVTGELTRFSTELYKCTTPEQLRDLKAKFLRNIDHTVDEEFTLPPMPQTSPQVPINLIFVLTCP